MDRRKPSSEVRGVQPTSTCIRKLLDVSSSKPLDRQWMAKSATATNRQVIWSRVTTSRSQESVRAFLSHFDSVTVRSLAVRACSPLCLDTLSTQAAQVLSCSACMIMPISKASYNMLSIIYRFHLNLPRQVNLYVECQIQCLQNIKKCSLYSFEIETRATAEPSLETCHL